MEIDSVHGSVASTLLILAAVVVLPWVLLLVFGELERRREHVERMKVLERDGVLPPAVRGTRPLWQAVVVGAGVPMLVSFVAINIRASAAFWHLVAAVAMLSAIPGTAILAGRADGRSAPGGPGKPQLHDADAYDTVSRRG